MRTLVHLSDLHFGRVDDRQMERLPGLIAAIRPDLVVVSGDLTQRARRREFVAARAFLDALPCPRLVVPGNHDVPLNLPARLFTPFRQYQRHIAADLEPSFVDDEIAIVGVNTARVMTRGGGRINARQVGRVGADFARLAGGRVKIVVTHHPFDLPPGHAARHLVKRADAAFSRLVETGADLFLSGHLHVGRAIQAAERFRISGHAALIVQAGTLSRRLRGEPASFNVIRIARPDLMVEQHVWGDGGDLLVRTSTQTFRQTEEGWFLTDRAPTLIDALP